MTTQRLPSVAPLVVVGSVNHDVTVRVHHLPRPGETVVATSLDIGNGGKGANQAVAAASCAEVPTVLVAAVGDDEDGARAIQSLAALHNSDHVYTVPGHPTGQAFLTVDEQGENSIVITPGANDHVFVDSPDAQRVILEAKVLLLQLEIPLSVTLRAAALAKSAGHPATTVILNAAPASPIPPELWDLVDVLIVNESEARYFARLTDEADATSGIETLLTHVPEVVLTLGAHGSIYASRSGESAVADPVRVTVTDTSGAGDTFCGAFAGSIALGATRREALRFAAAASSLSVQYHGARAGNRPRHEIEATTLANSETRPRS